MIASLENRGDESQDKGAEPPAARVVSRVTCLSSPSWRCAAAAMSEDYNSHPSFSRVSEGLTCPIFWNSKQASALSCAMSSTLHLHGEASPEFITTELRKHGKFSRVLARQSDNLNTTRAANDPSVFTITEKAPTTTMLHRLA